jgi:uncharacterized protein
MGHRDSSASDSGAGGVRAARSGIGAPAALDSKCGAEHCSEAHSELHIEARAESMSLMARGLLFSVRVYQAFFSALMPSACKFYPSCSHYAAEAVRIHGARRGSWLALRRVSRCHPFTPGGVDLVPDAPDFREAKSGAGFRLWGLVFAKSQNPQAEARATEPAARFVESSAKEARS